MTVPAAKGPVRLTLSASRHEETGEWQVMLPFWLEQGDLLKINCCGLVICYNSRQEVEADDEGDVIEPDVADPEAFDRWEVDLGSREQGNPARVAGGGAPGEAASYHRVQSEQ